MTTPQPAEPRISVLYDDSRRDLRDDSAPRPVRLYAWEPVRRVTDAGPLVVVSHGTGGSGSAMNWLVRPLVGAGFRVIALDHHGNNFVDGYEPEGFLLGWERARDVTFALDALAARGPLGPVGAAGFSFGGYTAGALAGARVDRDLVAAMLDGKVPEPLIPEFPALIAALRKKRSAEELAAAVQDSGANVSDPRVRAVFQVAPGLGSLVTPQSLAAIRIPVEIHWGGADTITPYAEDTAPYLAHVPGITGVCAGPGVRHEDFFEHVEGDEDARKRTGAGAAAFFLRHLTGPTLGGPDS
ncbi:alpha/beta hydrolase [Streptomyces sp. NBC_00247]|uniref:alpha/beta hydrolase family protein n=1 Tax=Streptomyces sp. NBC_00247 TaxID=2975689 RepID=UPI002E2D6CDC|nr:alpha/beta hydrolase [Streptomyces sp. NBC_00247]